MTVGSENILIPIFRTPREMQEWSTDRRRDGKSIGCVPTMGTLHDGHLSLINKSVSDCDETIVTIFVNPTQFGPDEDFRKYPRDEESDLQLARQHGATAAYCPSVDEMYLPDSSVIIFEEKISTVLCGRSRPTHFAGVTTVVAKLFNACLPDKAYFGLKDYQQIVVLKRMVRDLNFPVEIIGCPIIRESDGLAMSSRNRYLGEQERIDALCLSNALETARVSFNTGERNPREIEDIARHVIDQVDSARVDYLECLDAEDLSDIDIIESPAVLALAVFIGTTRLIDNLVLTSQGEVK